MPKGLLILALAVNFTFISCKHLSANTQENLETTKDAIKGNSINDTIVYQSEDLILKQLSDHVYEHISFLNTSDFGKVPCNGMLVINENKAIVFDTPTENKSSLELITFVTNDLNSEIQAVIPTHFHEDCIGGISEFEGHNIPILASTQTVGLLKNKNIKPFKLMKEFDDSLSLDIGNKKVLVEYFGEGHTTDNVIAYFPEDEVVFGGCLIKASGASKGNLEDANVGEWSNTIRKLKLKYLDAKFVIPGHGDYGGTELFDYTIELFETK